MFQDPVLYNTYNNWQYKEAEMALQKYNNLINYKENNLILDVGSGSGNVTTQVLLKFIPKCNFRLVGVDISQAMIDFINKNNEDTRLSFRVLDISEKNEDNLKSVFLEEELNPGFNTVFSFFCLHWTQDYKRSYKNVFSLMRPGGKILTLNGTYNDMFEVLESLRNSDKWQPYLKDVPVFKYPYYDSKDPTSECTNMLQEVGFQDIISYTHQTVVRPEGFGTTIRGLIEPLDPYLPHIPQDLRSDYVEDMVKIFEKFLEENPGIVFKMITVTATKPL